MSRDFQIGGESLIRVKGPAGSLIANITELGLAEAAISISLDSRYKELNLDAYGGEIPVDVQYMLAAANIQATLIHYDPAVLDELLRLSMGNATAVGTMPRAGTRLGNNVALGLAGNALFVVNVTSPIAGKPWRFPSCYMPTNPIVYPVGTEKSKVQVQFRAIPYQPDPYGGVGVGTGALGKILWDYTLQA